MESVGHVVVPLRTGGKKMRKRRELDALVAHSLAKRACNSGKRQAAAGNGIHSQDQLLSQSTDEHEDYTWSKVRLRPRCRTVKRFSCIKLCCSIFFLSSIIMILCLMYWLYFDLKQQISEQRIKIKEVSASSQNIPNELQKWHETSKTLEQNQTAMYAKIMDIQQRLDNFENELTLMKDVIKVKTENSDNMKLMNLEKNVADFGANIKDVKIDVDKLKENVHNLQEIQLINRNNLDNLTIKFETVVNNTASITPLTIFNHNNDTHEILNNINKTFINDYKNLSIQLFTINDTLNQKIKGLEVDLYKTKVDKLIDDFANMSSHVITIENDWSTYKQKSIDFEKTYLTINSELLNIKNNTKSLMADLYDFKIDMNAKMHNLSTIAIQKNNNNNIDNINKLKINLLPTQSSPLFNELLIDNDKNHNNNNNNNNDNILINKSEEVQQTFKESIILPLQQLENNNNKSSTSMLFDVVSTTLSPKTTTTTTTTSTTTPGPLFKIMNLTGFNSNLTNLTNDNIKLNNNNNNTNNNTIIESTTTATATATLIIPPNETLLVTSTENSTSTLSTTVTTSTAAATDIISGSKPKLLSVQKN